MIGIEQARDIATENISDGLRLSNALDGSSHWFFGVGDDLVDVVPDFSPIAVDKSTGNVSFPLPAVPSEVNGESPMPIEIEFSNAVPVVIPA